MSVNKNKRPKLSDKGNVKFFMNAAESMSACQIYREIAKNSIEAHAKMKKIKPDHEGIIHVKGDEIFKNKISIHDNGIGMSKNRIADLIINISETEEESEHGNYGIGTKVAGFANNKYGLIYTSKHKDEDVGSRCRVYFDETDLFGVEHSDPHNSCTIPVDLEDLPELIKRYGHGTSLVLGGNKQDECTLNTPEDYEKSSLLKGTRMKTQWLKAYFNTKFFRIPDYVKFLVEIIRTDRKNFERVYGHEHSLNECCSKKGVLEHESAKIYWWILSDDHKKRNSANDCFLKGQLGILHNDEIIDLKFDHTGMKNPIRHWGLDFSHKDIAIIIEPKGFKHDHYRTGLRKNKTPIDNFIPIFKEFFMENMPKEIIEYEEMNHKKYSKKMEDDVIFAKEMQDWLNDMNFKTSAGDELMSKDNLFGYISTTKGNFQGDFNNGENSVEPGLEPRSNMSSNPLYAGLKNKNSKNKGKKGSINSLPTVELRKDLDTWVEYNWDKHTIYIQEECILFEMYGSKAHKINREKSIGLHKTNAQTVIKKICQNIVCMVRYGNDTVIDLSEETRKEQLTNADTFKLPLLNTWMILNEVISLSKNIQKQLEVYENKKNNMLSKVN